MPRPAPPRRHLASPPSEQSHCRERHWSVSWHAAGSNGTERCTRNKEEETRQGLFSRRGKPSPAGIADRGHASPATREVDRRKSARTDDRRPGTNHRKQGSSGAQLGLRPNHCAADDSHRSPLPASAQVPTQAAAPDQTPRTIRLPDGSTARLVRQAVVAGVLPVSRNFDEAAWWGADLSAQRGATAFAGHVNWGGRTARSPCCGPSGSVRKSPSRTPTADR